MKYIEKWNETLSFIIGYEEVADDYQLKEETECLCTKQAWSDNVLRFEDKKSEKDKWQKNKVISHLVLKQRNKATEQIVKIIDDHYIIKTTRSDEKPEMWVYKEGIYLPEAKSLIKEVCRGILGESHTNQLTNEVIDKIEADTYIDQKEFFNKQNEYPYIIPVKNGLLNLKTKEIEGFSAKIPFFNKINAEYKPGTDCPNIKKFIREIVKNDEDYEIIQEIIGFCLIKQYKYEKAFMFYGSQGRNGKSKLLELITRFVGINNISGVSLEDIENDGFAISNLQNKLVNIAGDISNEAIKNTGRFKALTGRDTLSANRKFKERIDFINYAKIIFACNELPPVYTISRAFWLRWVLIEFPYQFLPEKEIKALEDQSRARLQDTLIIDKITTDDELNGLLNFAMEGLERLESQKDFSISSTAKELEQNWKRQSNSVSAFIDDCIQEDFTSYILKSDFLKRYQEYCKNHNTKIMSDKVIKITLKEELGISESQPSLDNIRVRVWNGIRWLSNIKKIVDFSVSEQGERDEQGFLTL